MKKCQEKNGRKVKQEAGWMRSVRAADSVEDGEETEMERWSECYWTEDRGQSQAGD